VVALGVVLRRTALPDGRVEVVFQLAAGPACTRAAVLGDFNGWSRDATPMARTEGGFEATVLLGPGTSHRFRYLLDGHRWENDPEADRYVANDFGSEDGVVDVVAAGRQRRGLGRGLSEIIDGSTDSRLAALLEPRTPADVEDLQRAGARLAELAVPGCTARWDDEPGSAMGVRFDLGGRTCWLQVHRDEPLSPAEVEQLHDVALLLLAALEPTGATSYRLVRAPSP
jgi:hypothetical protein